MNAVAVGWVGFISFVLFLPNQWPVSWESMNYAPVMAAGLVAAVGVWWWAGASEYYKGPRTDWHHGEGEREAEGSYERLLDE